MADDLSPAPTPAAPDELHEAVTRLDKAAATGDQQAAAAAAREVTAKWSEQLSRAGADVAGKINDPRLQISNPMAEALLRSGNAVSTARHLAENPARASQIARLSPAQQAVEIAKLSERVRLQRPAAPARPKEESTEAYVNRRLGELAKARANVGRRL